MGFLTPTTQEDENWLQTLKKPSMVIILFYPFALIFVFLSLANDMILGRKNPNLVTSVAN